MKTVFVLIILFAIQSLFSIHPRYRFRSNEDDWVDYLVGNTDVLFDKKTVQRILDVQQLPSKDAEHLFAMMDAFLRDAKTKNAYS